MALNATAVDARITTLVYSEGKSAFKTQKSNEGLGMEDPASNSTIYMSPPKNAMSLCFITHP